MRGGPSSASTPLRFGSLLLFFRAPTNRHKGPTWLEETRAWLVGRGPEGIIAQLLNWTRRLSHRIAPFTSLGHVGREPARLPASTKRPSRPPVGGGPQKQKTVFAPNCHQLGHLNVVSFARISRSARIQRSLRESRVFRGSQGAGDLKMGRMGWTDQLGAAFDLL